MKILYVVSRPLEINTSASIRNRATIDGLIELGHDVHLITSEYDTNHSAFDGSLINQKIHVTYLKVGGVQNFAKIGRKLKYLRPLKKICYEFMSKTDIYDNLKVIVEHVSELPVNDNSFDLVISSSDPKSSHLFVLEMFRRRKIVNTPWIQIWGDPFASDITRKGDRLSQKIKQEEEILISGATKVIYVSNLTLIEQKKLYPKHADKMAYLPIPYMEEKIYKLKSISNETKITLVYCGDYNSDVRNIFPLYNAAVKTKCNLIICGQSDIHLENTSEIKIYPRVPYEKTKEFEESADVLVHVSNLKGNQIPGKIYQYSGTNKPILFIVDGDVINIKKTFTKYNRYIFCNNTVDGIGEGIQEIKNGCANVENTPITDFSAIKIANQIIEIAK